jgi:hypothetical protein
LSGAKVVKKGLPAVLQPVGVDLFYSVSVALRLLLCFFKREIRQKEKEEEEEGIIPADGLED